LFPRDLEKIQTLQKRKMLLPLVVILPSPPLTISPGLAVKLLKVRLLPDTLAKMQRCKDAKSVIWMAAICFPDYLS